MPLSHSHVDWCCDSAANVCLIAITRFIDAVGLDDTVAVSGGQTCERPSMKLILSILIYAVTIVGLGFTCIFAALSHDILVAWPQYLGIVADQLISPRRAPFAWIIATFVVSVPVSLGGWQAWRIKSGSAPSKAAVASSAFLIIFGSYIVFYLAIALAAADAPVLSVMESVNLKFALIVLGLWGVFAILLAMPAGAAVNRLLGSK